MAQYADLKAAINAVIKQNNNQEITGSILNSVLNAMVNSLGANYQLAGVATPSTNPGTPDQNVFYLAFQAGTYTNFNSIELPAGISMLKWNGSWTGQTWYTIDDEPMAGSNNLVKSGGVVASNNLLKDRVGIPALRNGSAGNPTNAKFISTYVFPTFGKRYIRIITDRPNTSGCHYAYGIALTASVDDLDSTEKYDLWNNKLYKVDVNSTLTNNVIDISAYPTAVGISITVGEFDNNSVATTLRTTDFEKYSVKIEYLDDIKELQTSIQQNIQQEATLRQQGDSTLNEKINILKNRASVPALRNGSAGNPDNVKLISTYVFPILSRKHLKIEIDRPNTEGCHYAFGIALTSSVEDLDSSAKYDSWNNKLYKLDVSSTTYNNKIIDLTNYPTAVGIMITVGEYNSSAVATTLRTTDFEKYSIKITDIDTKLKLEEDINVLNNKLDVIKNRVELPVLHNGSSGNPGNAKLISTNVIPTFGKKYIKVIINRPNAEGYHYAYGIALTASVNDLDSSAKYDSWNSKLYQIDVNSTLTNNVIDISAYPTAIGISITIGEFNNNSVANTLRITDFEKYSIKVEYLDDIKELQNSVKLFDIVIKGQYIDGLQNGSIGNSGNANAVCNIKIIDVSNVSSVKFYTTRKNLNGYKYRYWYVIFNESSGNVRPATTYRVIREVGYVDSDVITINQGEKGLGIGIVEVDKVTGNYNPLRVTDFANEDCYVLFDESEIRKLDARITELEGEIGQETFYNNPVIRYKDKTKDLVSASRYNVGSSGAKDLQMLIITDIHSDTIPTENSVMLTNSFKTIDALICLGDIVGSQFYDAFKSTFINIMNNCNKPFYICLGNHDVGNSYYVGRCANHQQEYDTFIKPIIDAGNLIVGEYSPGLSYYFHDFTNRKVRLIVLNEYDEPLDFDETYWEPVTYNDSYNNIATSTAYSIGDYVNVPNYTEHSFRCVQALTTPSAIGDATKAVIPSYRIKRGTRVIMQTQAQWFLDTLFSTPADYSVVVAVHAPFSGNSSNQVDKKFAQNIAVSGTAPLQSAMVTDFIANAVNAFVNGENYLENIVMKDEAAYLNTEGGGTYSYTVSKDFSGKASGVKFLCYIGGHCHRDLIFKHNTYNQYEVSPICAATDYGNSANNDIRREVASYFGNGYGVDSLTCISFDPNRKVRLVKIGSELTLDMERRDFELIDLNS